MQQESLFKQFKSGFTVIAGPCSVESREQIHQTAKILEEENVCFLRGGIYKLRTSYRSFQGRGKQAVEWMRELKACYKKLNFVSEITDIRQMDILSPVVDIFQVGARNMYNYELLKELGKQAKPVLLKRAFSARVKEWLMAAEYLSQNGNERVILCERGIRTFETETRNTLDLAGALVAKRESSFPVIADPSHGTGKSELVGKMALSILAAGLNGLMVEIHPEPEKALSDGRQSLNFTQFKQSMKQIRKMQNFMN